MSKFPKYVEQILARSQWKMPWYMHGKVREGFYTFAIRKNSDYTTARVFRKEIERFVDWANREARKTYGFSKDYKVAYLVRIPEKTRHDEQWAIVKITDPVMRDLEDFILEEARNVRF